MVYTLVLETSAERLGGSSPSPGTKALSSNGKDASLSISRSGFDSHRGYQKTNVVIAVGNGQSRVQSSLEKERVDHTMSRRSSTGRVVAL